MHKYKYYHQKYQELKGCSDICSIGIKHYKYIVNSANQSKEYVAVQNLHDYKEISDQEGMHVYCYSYSSISNVELINNYYRETNTITFVMIYGKN